jgi:hypothetical protein
MMRIILKLMFSLVIVIMLVATVQASLGRSVLQALEELWPDPWFRATLADAYFGFLTVFVWIAYRERGLLPKILWFIALMLLGNFAIAGYVLIQLFRLPPGAPIESMLLRKED